MAILSLKRRTKIRSALVANTRWGLINPLGRGLFGGGIGSGGSPNYNVIDYIMIATTGNATDYGDLTFAVNPSMSNGASTTRGLFNTRRSNGGANDLEYLTISTGGNTAGFGNLTTDRSAYGTSSSTRALYGGGETGGGATRYNIIDYVTIASTGNATDFGDLSVTRYAAVAAASPTRAVWAGGNTNASGAGATNVIDYVTIATTGNATDFGDLTLSRDGVGGASNNVRALFMSGIDTGTSISNIIDYITISSAGNAVDFGDISSARRYSTGLASATRCVFSGGLTGGGGNYASTATMEYVTISTTGNSTTFGDLTVNRWLPGTVSASHGGIAQDVVIGAAQAFAAGGSPINGVTSTIQTVDIATLGDTVYFGELTSARDTLGGFGSSTRGVFAGGNNGSANINTIDYIEYSSAGNASSFGNLSGIAKPQQQTLSNSTRGLIGLGLGSGGYTNTVDYVTIASAGNALSFGALSQNRAFGSGFASSTRGIIGNGFLGSNTDSSSIDYFTIASTGNATSFGNSTLARYHTAGCSNSTRGLFGGGQTSSNQDHNIIEYVTIATTGNATDFGDFTSVRFFMAGAASSTRAIFMGKSPNTSTGNIIEYVTIASTGNSADFGDLLVPTTAMASASNAHGGI